ncbi:MAG: hypothetical protein HQM10_12960 [Candidatus Riflebacteria bacterium]|nr:hypothetical protein [Candidatus Riflebacteria bacterium]
MKNQILTLIVVVIILIGSANFAQANPFQEEQSIQCVAPEVPVVKESPNGVVNVECAKPAAPQTKPVEKDSPAKVFFSYVFAFGLTAISLLALAMFG